MFLLREWKKKGQPQCKSCFKKGEGFRRDRNAYYMKTYEITLEEYEEMLLKQGGCCAICRKKPGRRRLAVDHDHAISEEWGMRPSVRGLLCNTCNEFLGHTGDDPIAGLRLMNYLDDPPTRLQ